MNATREIIDDSVLLDIADSDASAEVRIDAILRIGENLLGGDAAERKHEAIRRAVDRFSGDPALVRFAKTARNSDARIRAIELILREPRLCEPPVFFEIAKASANPLVRGRAVACITDQQILYRFAMDDNDGYVRKKAAEAVSNADILLDVIRGSDDESVRLAAMHGLLKQGRTWS